MEILGPHVTLLVRIWTPPGGAWGSGNTGPPCDAFGQNLDTPLEGPGVVEILGPYVTLLGRIWTPLQSTVFKPTV